MIDPGRPDTVAPALLDVLRSRGVARAPRLREPLRRLAGGFHTFVYAFRLEPPGPCEPLVLRVQRPHEDGPGAAFEACLHGALRAQGYPAPRVLVACDAPERLGGPFLVMERVPGRPLVRVEAELAGDVRADVVRLVLGGWPSLLADVHAQLHRVDPAPVVAALEADGFDPRRIGLDFRIARLADAARHPALAGLRAGISWLRDQLPLDGHGPGVCHGDLFPNQVYAEAGRITGVIDWTECALAPPEIDVGLVKAGIETAPVDLPRPMRRLGRRSQRWLAERFLARYRTLRPLDPRALRFGEVLRCVQVLAGVAQRRLQGPPARDPFGTPAALERATAYVEERTGIRPGHAA